MENLFYWGKELPQTKEWGGRLPVAVVFPEKESFALSTLGWQSVYRLFAADDGFAPERVFWDNKKSPVPRSVDSGRELGAFPFICFSLNFEGDFVAVIQMLEAAGIDPLARQRNDWPIIMAGGPIAFLNPFPILPSLDFVFCGEVEQGFAAVAQSIKKSWLTGEGKTSALHKIEKYPGILSATSKQVERQLVWSDSDLMHPAYSSFVSSKAEFRDMLLLEVNRGCPYGCRFCAAGFIYRPPRHAHLSELQRIVDGTKPLKVGLVGTALTDWPDLLPFLQWLHSQKIKFSLSSLRADGLTRDFVHFLRRKAGLRTLTLALEGASSRLRQAMNKRFDEQAFLQAVHLASEFQFNTLKLYLITGWPDENEQDWNELKLLLEKVQEARAQGKGKRKTGLDLISISVSCLVPKPWTPLQWATMADEKWLKHSMSRIKALLKPLRGVRISTENPFQARVQALLARADESVHGLLLLQAKNQNWRQSLRDWNGDINKFLAKRSLEEDFVWDKITIGVDKRYLVREWLRFQSEQPTATCPAGQCGAGCLRCGVGELKRYKSSI